MSFSVYFANSSKPENSTHAFSTSGLTPYMCTMKKGTSVLNPVIEFQVSFTDFATLSTSANVAYIGSLGRYYFVTDWKFDGVLAVCYLSVDVLATYWDAMKVKTCLVTRSASQQNKSVVDTEYPTSAYRRTQQLAYNTNPFQPPATDYGCYIVGILSKNGGLDGCITYYVMSYLVFMTFMSKQFNYSIYGGGAITSTGTNNDTFSTNLTEALINPMQYIASIMWYPFTTSQLNTLGFLESTTTVYVGYSTINLGVTAYRFDDATLYKRMMGLISFTITPHPYHNDHDSFLNLSPYSEYRLSFYPFGAFAIDGIYLQGFSTLYCLWSVDLRSGRGVLNVGTSIMGTDASTWTMPANFLTAEAQIGVPIPTSTVQTMLPDMGVLEKTAITGTATGAFSGLVDRVKSAFNNSGNTFVNKVVGGAFEEAMNATGSLIDDIGNFIDSSGVTSSASQAFSGANLSGSQGSISLYPKQPVAFSSWFAFRTYTDPARKGLPLCENVLLSTLSGYTVCTGVVADIQSITFAEKRKLENFMNTGFYIAS